MELREVMYMKYKLIAAFIALAMLAALVPVTQADSGGIKPYKGLIGADSPLYPVKIFVQNMDVTLTFNNTDKMNKQVNYANERVSEMLAGEEENNSEAIEAAANEYVNVMDGLEETTQAEDIDQAAYADLQPIFVHHMDCIGNITNTTTGLNDTVQVRVNNAYMKALGLKNGMPFYYYNGMTYFIPPGQRKNMEKNMENGIYNGSKVPPGLAKKGYTSPELTINNGSKAWPWDQIPYPTSKKNNGNGNGNGNGNPNK
jgi:hypothetical protein